MLLLPSVGWNVRATLSHGPSNIQIYVPSFFYLRSLLPKDKILPLICRYEERLLVPDSEPNVFRECVLWKGVRHFLFSSLNSFYWRVRGLPSQ